MKRTLARLFALVAGLLVVALLPLATPASAADDYPYRTDTTNASDPWGFTKRQCVSFAAWRLHQAGRPLKNVTEQWNNARTWDDTARRLGYRVTSRPVRGAVAQWNAGERSAYYANGSSRPNGTVTAGSYGHVAVVKKVFDDGSVLVEQYNMGSDRRYGTMRLKAPRYLHVR